jgi:hypothetical protein
LLEGIGVISKADNRKASARGGNYQDAVTAPVSRDYDNSGIIEDEDDGEAVYDDPVEGSTQESASLKAAPKAIAVEKV